MAASSSWPLHSPILAAIPEAAILEMEEGNLTPPRL